MIGGAVEGWQVGMIELHLYWAEEPDREAVRVHAEAGWDGAPHWVASQGGASGENVTI